jgi:serine/threonine protein kinase
MSIANITTKSGDITLQNFSLSQVVQSDRVITLEMTIELLVALLQSLINKSKIDGQITPDRVLIISENPTRVQILATKCICVDPEFSAPEILDGKISPSSDLYSIGLITIYLLTGIRPFQLFDMVNQCWAWQDYWQIPIQASRINYPKLAAILNRSIELDPDVRFSSAREMITAVQDCVPNLAPLPPNWSCKHTLIGHQGLFTKRMFGKYKQAPVEKKLPRIVRLDKNLSPNSHRGSHDSSLHNRIDIGTV